MVGYVFQFSGRSRDGLEDHAELVWSKYSNAQRVSNLHLSKDCLNPPSRSDTYSSSAEGVAMDWKGMLSYISGSVDEEFLLRNEYLVAALLHGPAQIADLPVPVGESPGAVSIGHAERGHLVEYLTPNSVFNSLPRQRSSPHLGPHDRLVTIDRVLHHASLGAA